MPRQRTPPRPHMPRPPERGRAPDSRQPGHEEAVPDHFPLPIGVIRRAAPLDTGTLGRGSAPAQADDSNCLRAAVSLDYFELDLFALIQRLVAFLLYRGVMNEDVVLPIALDEPVTFLSVEPLDSASQRTLLPLQWG